MEEKILEEVISDLGVNYSKKDEELLIGIIEDVINNALYIANRNNKSDRDNQINKLKFEIKRAVKIIYLQRGTEDVSSRNADGENSTYKDAYDTLRNDIIKNGKRVLI